jgi:hypothetical protein
MKNFINIFILSSLFAVSLHAETLSLGNRWLQVTLDSENGVITMARDQGETPVASMTLECTGEIKEQAVTDKTFGRGRSLTLTASDQSVTDLSVFSTLPFVLIKKTINSVQSQCVTNRVVYPEIKLSLPSSYADLNSLGTGGLLAPDKNPGSYMWTAVADKTERKGIVTGWITTDRGSGIVRMSVTNEVISLLPHLDYGRLLLKPGQSETLETLVIGYFEDARLGLEAYADALVKVYHIKLPPMPTVHCTWYVDGASNEKALAERTLFTEKELKPFGLNVMQIDVGWQLGLNTNGPSRVFNSHKPDGPYPSGMKKTADSIRASGMTAGIWLIPFAGTVSDPWYKDKHDWFAKRDDGSAFVTRWGGTCFDLTRRDTQEHLKGLIKTITQDWGYKYLKMDGLYTGAAINLNYVCDTWREDEIGAVALSNPEITQIQMMRNSLDLVRKEAGNDCFILGCCAPQNMRSAGAVFGKVDAMRIGPDNGASWKSLLRGPDYGSWQYFLNGRVWYNDPDPLYVRNTLSLEHARVITSFVTLSGQMNSSSEHYAQLKPERLDMLKRTMPSHQATARPVDLFENRTPRIWTVTDGVEEKRMDVVGLFNWASQSQDVAAKAEYLGLPKADRYIAFEYWSNSLIPAFENELKYQLAPQSCAVLSVRPLKEHPQVISTSRHITQGMIDLSDESWSSWKKRLSGVSKVVAADPYELRILTMTTGSSYKHSKIELSDADQAAGVTASAKLTEGLVRVTLRSPVSRAVKWSVSFEKSSELIQPQLANAKVELADAYSPVVLTWAGNTSSTEIKRNGEVVAASTTGGRWQDDKARSGVEYLYEFTPVTLDGRRGATQTVTFKVMDIPVAGEAPPLPEVYIDSLKPLKTATGWGGFKVNTAYNGPLTLQKEKFDHGVCIHAEGFASYKREPSWKRFVAVVGIDESQRPQNQSSIKFSISAEAADGTRLLAASPVLRFGQCERWYFDVKLPDDALRIVIRSETAGDGNKSDHGNWCNAGFIK